jgi:hypothetical protein
MTSSNEENAPYAGRFEQRAHEEVLYVAPKPVPTGTFPVSNHPLHRSANEVYLDLVADTLPAELVIRWSIGSIVGPALLLFFGALALDIYIFLDTQRPAFAFVSATISEVRFLTICFLTLICCYTYGFIKLIYKQRLSPPLRFNRQRREVAYVAKRGKAPCIVPWEEVIAGVACIKTTTEHGTQDSFVLKIGLRDESDETIWITIPAENQAFALAEWEAIRVYMEEGPDALPVPFMAGMSDIGTVAYFHECRRDYRKFRGWFCYLFGFLPIHLCSGWTLPNHLAEWIERLPGTSFPKAIREWSRPLPREQWATPSIELLEESKAMKRSFKKGTGLFQYFQEKTRQP